MNDFESLDLGSTPSTGTKKCSKCKNTHFELNSSYCKSCKKEYAHNYHLTHLQSRRQKNIDRRIKNRELIKEYKDAPCLDCGIKYPPYVMDFDHVSGDKKFRVSQVMRAASLDDMKNEMSKCELVCANCHRIRTARRITGEPIL